MAALDIAAAQSRGRRSVGHNAQRSAAPVVYPTPAAPPQALARTASPGSNAGAVVPAAGGARGTYIPKCGEMGLLEVMYRTRAAEGSAGRVPVCSRPEAELRLNFTDFEGAPCDLAHRVLLQGKMGVMREQLSGVADSAQITGREFKGIAGNLQGFVAPEYLLVAYKDYSPWAVHHYRRDAKGAGWLNPWGARYVVKHFAVEVSTVPGTFIKLSESQFLVGCNKLHLARQAGGGGCGDPTGTLLAHLLTQEQLNAILNIRAPGQDSTGGGGGGGGDPHDTRPSRPAGPAPAGDGGTLLDYVLSWTPVGWYRRMRDDAYRAIGSAAVTLLLYAAVGLVAYRYVVAPLVLPALRAAGGGGSAPPPTPRRGYNTTQREQQAPAAGLGTPFSFLTGRVGDVFDRILLGSGVA
eukprot:TRINITY_DN24911_c0_g1_i1.p1 TRINITY_DN24911_c0_g1~~TRINITY_DN24911_c0_g1_i1.p1  ORF type:complete len:408 (+),score=127.50 TRINITY_DN24911_c0_g1_i1:43-1266(+)